MKRLTGVTVVLAGIAAIGGLFGMSEAGPAFRPGGGRLLAGDGVHDAVGVFVFCASGGSTGSSAGARYRRRGVAGASGARAWASVGVGRGSVQRHREHLELGHGAARAPLVWRTSCCIRRCHESRARNRVAWRFTR